MAFGGRSQLKMSEETFDFVCNSCAQNHKTVEAVKYCVECSGYCCQTCVDTHKMFPALKNHTLLDVSQGNQASDDESSLLEFPTERCSQHKCKVVDMYCESHDVVGCYVCIAKYHKSCQDDHIHSIPDMIDTIFKLSDCKQTQSLLKDMMISMATVSESKDTQLETLNKAKQETLDKVTTFQKALEAIVRKASDCSRQEVEAAYKELEKTILQEKHNAEDLCEALKTADDNLNQSEGNRAQKFVLTKIAAEKIKEADSEQMQQDSRCRKAVQVTFVPDQSLIGYIKAITSIGQVQTQETQKHDAYKIKGSSDIPIKLSDDSSVCRSFGCCLTHDDHLLVTDRNNKKLKRIDIHRMTVVDYCTLDSLPYGVCFISKQEVAVACMSDNKIQVVSIDEKMTPTRHIKMSHKCYGVAFNGETLFVTDTNASLYLYDMVGTLLKKVSQDNARNNLFSKSRHITFGERGNNMWVGTGNGNGVACLDTLGTYRSSIIDAELGFADGVCVDGRGNLFAVGNTSHTVVQFSKSGKKIGVVVKKGDGFEYPFSVCFHQGLNTLFVTLYESNVVKMYELE